MQKININCLFLH